MNRFRHFDFRRLFQVMVILVVSSSAFAARPNVIVILSDYQCWGDLSLNGNTNLSTPNVD